MAPDYLEHYESLVENTYPEDRQSAVLAIETLLDCLQQTNPSTLTEFLNELSAAEDQLCKTSKSSLVSMKAGCDALRRFVSLTRTEALEGEGFRDALIAKGRQYLEAARRYRPRIANLASKLIQDQHTIMVHSNSSVVLYALMTAVERIRIKRIYVTRCDYDNSGLQMMDWIKHRIGGKFARRHVRLINDTCVGPLMRSCDLVLLGAEAVTPDGGIINRVGSLNIAICADAFAVPVYALAETFKFVSYLPQSGGETGLQPEFSVKNSQLMLDYTPGQYITGLVTDIGVLTPQSVGEEIIKLYK